MNKQCATCNKQFKINNSWRLGRSKNYYCSNKCKGIGVNKANKNGKEINCLICKKIFYISKSRIGKIACCSLECAIKNRVGKQPKNMEGLKLGRRSGKLSGGWKGGVTPINIRLRRGKAYKKWRKAIFERDNYTCQICGQRGGVLNSDHIKPFSTHPELRFEEHNGRTLCHECHKKTDTYGGRGRRIIGKEHANQCVVIHRPTTLFNMV